MHNMQRIEIYTFNSLALNTAGFSTWEVGQPRVIMSYIKYHYVDDLELKISSLHISVFID